MNSTTEKNVIDVFGINSELSLTTAEFANNFRIAGQTVRKNYCLTGHCYGIKPLKVGNKLLWPANEVAMRLAGGMK